MSPETSDLAFAVAESPVGAVGLVRGPRGYVRVQLPVRGGASALRRRLQRDHPGAVEDAAALADGVGAVAAWAVGEPPPRGIRLDLSGVSPFYRRVYGVLRRIRRGRVLTYAEVARRAGSPGAHRSVGSALARNPLPLLVPCHRVVRSDGSLGGFSAPGGLVLKERMLRHEGAL